MKSFSFAPISKFDAKILILGSMPGKTSLEKNEYYAYKHNTFWRIIFDLFNLNSTNNYEQKTKILINNKIALWDTLKYCDRSSSLDSDIKNEMPNNFTVFFSKHQEIRHIMFNGSASYKYFKKYIGLNENFEYHILPSTSPANASKTYSEKLNDWTLIMKLLKN